MIYINRHPVKGVGDWMGPRGVFWGVLKMLCILIVVVIQLYIIIKTPLTVHIKWVAFIVCKL